LILLPARTIKSGKNVVSITGSTVQDAKIGSPVYYGRAFRKRFDSIDSILRRRPDVRLSYSLLYALNGTFGVQTPGEAIGENRFENGTAKRAN